MKQDNKITRYEDWMKQGGQIERGRQGMRWMKTVDERTRYEDKRCNEWRQIRR